MQDRKQVLIVDDDEQMLLAMETVVARLGHAVFKCSNGAEAMDTLAKTDVHLVISDLRMPVMTGEELLVKVGKTHPRLPVVMITAYGTIAQAVEAMKNGAYDFITKPFSAEDLEGVIQRVLNPPRKSPVTKTPKQSESDYVAIVTNDLAFKRLLEISSNVAQSSASVLIQGESGTGKELIARLIHSSSKYSSGSFVAVNCAALPGNLLESELFGHEKGAFTGAVGTRIGKFEQAHGGTILLDEISEMEDTLQAKLLRVLQEREIDRVGGNKPIPIDVRIIATTNRDIKESVQNGKFREDLYYRLNVIPLFVPPLRDRKGDVKLLVDHFTRKFSANPAARAPDDIANKLEEYSWPGNVRELQNACERAVILAHGGDLQLEHFFLGAVPAGERSSPEDELRLVSGLTVAEAEKKLILETLRATGNNRTKAAELLGISIRTLRNKLNEYGVPGKAGGESEIA